MQMQNGLEFPRFVQLGKQLMKKTTISQHFKNNTQNSNSL